MIIRREKVIVVDIEATCWKGGLAPQGMQSEIIEIGVCVLPLKTRKPTDKLSILVRPERSTISDFCTELTTLTQEQVDAGVNFREACTILERDYETKEYIWASWGKYDRKMFRAQCEERGVPFPFSDRHVNLKKLCARLHGRRQVGMQRALALAGLPLEGTHHRAADDAWNIARLLAYMLKRVGKDILLEAW